MSTGRCAGCGKVGQPGKIRDHQMSCEKFAVLFKADRASLLPVEQEYERWVAAGRPAERAQVHAQSVADTDARRAAMAERYRTVDILED